MVSRRLSVVGYRLSAIGYRLSAIVLELGGREGMGDYRKLEVWQRAHRLTLDIYRVTQQFPKEELYGLTGQLRRSSSSIPANLAEGCGRNGDAELARFVDIALGSVNELDYHLMLSRDLGYLQTSQFEFLTAEAQGVAKMLSALGARLRASSNKDRRADSR
jgi:four helix bundle protein